MVEWSTTSVLLTWNAEMINCHARKSRKPCTVFSPPCQSISDILNVGVEVDIQLVIQYLGLGLGKEWEIIEYIVV